MRAVAERIADRILHVPDQRLLPVGEIKGAIGTELHVDGPEIGIVAEDQRLDLLALETAAGGADLVLEHAKHPDGVVEQEAPLGLVGEVAARDKFAAAGRAHAFDEPVLHRGVFFRIRQVAGEGGAKVVRAAGGVGDEGLPPAVEGHAVGIGVAVAHEDLEFVGQRLEAVRAGVLAAHRTVGCLNLREMKRALLEIEGATRRR